MKKITDFFTAHQNVITGDFYNCYNYVIEDNNVVLQFFQISEDVKIPFLPQTNQTTFIKTHLQSLMDLAKAFNRTFIVVGGSVLNLKNKTIEPTNNCFFNFVDFFNDENESVCIAKDIEKLNVQRNHSPSFNDVLQPSTTMVDGNISINNEVESEGEPLHFDEQVRLKETLEQLEDELKENQAQQEALILERVNEAAFKVESDKVVSDATKDKVIKAIMDHYKDPTMQLGCHDNGQPYIYVPHMKTNVGMGLDPKIEAIVQEIIAND